MSNLAFDLASVICMLSQYILKQYYYMKPRSGSLMTSIEKLDRTGGSESTWVKVLQSSVEWASNRSSYALIDEHHRFTIYQAVSSIAPNDTDLFLQLGLDCRSLFLTHEFK
jgi:hypothetical protein